jgi:formiminotetrahydrofolate cyclodeaminase
MPPTKLTDLSLTAFAAALADKTPTPGGGSLAAYVIACGAATVSMAYRFTSGDKYAAVQESMVRRAAELDELRGKALDYVDADSRAYDRVTSAFGAPKSNDTEKSARSAGIQAAMKGALEVPLETMRVATAVLKLAAEGAGSINPNLASDCGSGVACCLAGLDAAQANVAINAASIKDADYVAARRAEAAALRAEALRAAEQARAALAAHLPS